jgi:hypothetical protein
MLSRRTLLGTPVALAALQGAGTAVAAAGSTPRIPASPVERLNGFMRLFSATAGSRVLTNEGIIYGRAPGELPRPLVGFLCVLEIRVEEVEPGLFQTRQMEAMICTDLATRQPLVDWTNPYTHDRVQPVGYASPENIYHFDTTGSYGATLPPARSGQARLDWRVSDHEIWVTETRPNSFPAGITEAEFPRAYAGPVRNSVDILTYRAPFADFAGGGDSVETATLTMLTDAPWPLWMMMGRHPGGVLWQGFGAKYRTLADLPAATRAVVEQTYPSFLSDPWRFPRAEWSTVAQLRRIKDAAAPR